MMSPGIQASPSSALFFSALVSVPDRLSPGVGNLARAAPSEIQQAQSSFHSGKESTSFWTTPTKYSFVPGL